MSGTVKFTPIIKDLVLRGKTVYNFAVGEPDLPTPQPVIDATIDALSNNKTGYSSVSGLAELKEEICRKLERDNRISYDKENILVSNGSKQSLYTLFQAICSKDDEIIVPNPYWVSYHEQIMLAQGKPVIAETSCHQLDIESIKEKLSPKTKAVIINSPNNPTGAVYPKKDLKALADLASGHNFVIISDEAYEALVYDDKKHISPASLDKETKEKTITIQSFSKGFRMPGFRLGYIAGNENLIKAMANIQSHMTGNPCTFAQYGAIAALKMDHKEIENQVYKYQKKRDLAYRYAKKSFDCIRPEGAFYLFPSIKEHLNDDIHDSEEFCRYLLSQAGIASVPGKYFGKEGYARFSYACSSEEIKQGFELMEKIL